MNATARETPEGINVEEHARIVMTLLREYAEKLRTLTQELSACFHEWLRLVVGGNYNQAAWLLDPTSSRTQGDKGGPTDLVPPFLLS